MKYLVFWRCAITVVVSCPARSTQAHTENTSENRNGNEILHRCTWMHGCTCIVLLRRCSWICKGEQTPVWRQTPSECFVKASASWDLSLLSPQIILDYAFDFFFFNAADSEDSQWKSYAPRLSGPCQQKVLPHFSLMKVVLPPFQVRLSVWSFREV